MTNQKLRLVEFGSLPVQLSTTEGLRIFLLGGFRLLQGENTLSSVHFHLHKACDLVKLLALAPRHRMPREQVLEWLWPDGDPRSSTNNLNQALRSARNVLEAFQPPVYIRNEDGLLELVSDEALWVDVEAFEAAAARARRSQDISLCRAALELYAGELLPEDRYAEWAVQRREILKQTFLKLLLDLAHLHEAHGENQPAIESFQALIAVDPLIEEAHVGLMRNYALSGQRSQALRQYQLLQDILSNELATEPDLDSQKLHRQILEGKYPPPEKQAQLIEDMPQILEERKHNLPFQMTSFIGREQELVQVKELLSSHRLVTLTGPGGVGKTRLALKLAESTLKSFADGVWLVELSPLPDSDLVPQAVAQALGIYLDANTPVLTRLMQYLEKKHILVILDNCEHLLPGCTRLVDTLLKNCPQLHILGTSRENFSLPGEASHHLPTLTFPDPHSWPGLDELSQFEAIHLFVERASLVLPGFSLSPKNAGAVVRVCQRLDGIPLAIELAAARLRLLSVEQISDRLEDAFQLLTGGSPAALPRHQTLRASIDWSYNLLSSQEQQLLQRLSVFTGGWSLEAAEAMWKENPAGLLDLMGQLVSKSLVIVDAHFAQPRYHLLDTIHRYAQEKLLESGGETAARDLHLDYFASLTKQAAQHLRSRGMIEWLERLDLDRENLNLAMEWSMVMPGRNDKIEKGLQIAADLDYYWWVRGLTVQHMGLRKRLLAAELEQRGDIPLTGNRSLQRARALIIYQEEDVWDAALQESMQLLRSLGPSARRDLGIALYYFTNKPSTPPPPDTWRECLLIFRQEQDLFWLSECYHCIGYWYFVRGQFTEARKYCEESLVWKRQIEDIDGIALTILSMAEYDLFVGDYQKSRELLNEALDQARGLKNLFLDGRANLNLLQVALAEGNYAEASQYAEKTIASFREFGWQPGIYEVLWQEAKIAWSMGDFKGARMKAEALVGLADISTSDRANGIYVLGRIALTLGETGKAESLLKQAFAFVDESFLLHQKAMLLTGYVSLCSKQGRMVEATQCAGAIDEILQKVFLGLPPRMRDEYQEGLETACASLSESAFDQAWESGKLMTLEQLIQEIISAV
jgi:predicted ATPase/DNA-binding SARP family transcriptional activator